MHNINRQKIPVSAVVVSHNEGHLLTDCLESVQFCQEIICIDLESHDNTKEVSEPLTTKYFQRKRVPVIEHLFPWICEVTTYDWILFIDPDEYLTNELQRKIIDIFDAGIPENIGEVKLPWVFYYDVHALKGTFWGNKQKGSLRHRLKNHISTDVHKGIILKEEYESLQIKPLEGVYIHHKWMQNFNQLIEKHKRYIPLEADNRHKEGFRFKSIIHLYFWAFLDFYRSFFKMKGYKDGYIGFKLSLFWSWYNFKAYALLKDYE